MYRLCQLITAVRKEKSTLQADVRNVAFPKLYLTVNNCQKYFITDKKNENYCDRIAPDKVDAFNRFWSKIGEARGIEEWEELPTSAWRQILSQKEKQKLENLTCKKVGYLKTWKEGLSNEELAFLKEKHRRVSHLYYLKRKEAKDEYQRAKEDFDEWLRENRPKRR